MKSKYSSFSIGLIIGLIISAIFASYITKLPIPFRDKIDQLQKENYALSSISKEKNLLKLQDCQKLMKNKKDLLINNPINDLNIINNDMNIINQYKEINNKTYYLQVGSYKNINNAQLFKNKIEKFLNLKIIIQTAKNKDYNVYRVLIGPFLDIKEIDTIQKNILDKHNIKSTIIIRQ
ncbi:SPOR domain-containing protein [Candidatus Kinetoplastibacterium sorsogonicusi]|nr:SPOR domain-containing protein [Candidatus Kinetoplastibacterium sorsogonicusi]